MTTKLNAGDFFAKKNQLFKVLEYKEGDEKTGHRSRDLNVITQCTVCQQQREIRGNATNFLRCLRCRSTYDPSEDEIYPPTDEKDLNKRDYEMLQPLKVYIKKPEVVESESEAEESESEEEELPKKKTKPVAKKTGAFDLKSFAKGELSDILSKVDAKTSAAIAPPSRKARGKKIVEAPDDGDVDISEGGDEVVVAAKPPKKHRPIDVTKSVGIVETSPACPQPKPEMMTVVRLKPGQTYIHQGILFIAE